MMMKRIPALMRQRLHHYRARTMRRGRIACHPYQQRRRLVHHYH